MKKLVEKDVVKELESIYGIENCKGEILDYVKYLKISKKSNFANYNIIIHNNSSYPGETKNRLIEFLSKRLEKEISIFQFCSDKIAVSLLTIFQ